MILNLFGFGMPYEIYVYSCLHPLPDFLCASFGMPYEITVYPCLHPLPDSLCVSVDHVPQPLSMVTNYPLPFMIQDP